MPAWTRGRLRILIFTTLLVVALLLVASFLYFRAGQKTPEGADVVLMPGFLISVGATTASG